MEEYRNTKTTKPVILKRSDLSDLIELLQSDESKDLSIKVEIAISLSDGDRIVESTSLIELLGHRLPNWSDNLAISQRVWKANRIVSGVSINLIPTMVQFQIHSEDHTWFLGRSQQLQSYFARHRPWYYKLRLLPAFFFGMVAGTGVPLIPLAIELKRPNTTVAAITMIVGGIALTVVGSMIAEKTLAQSKVFFQEGYHPDLGQKGMFILALLTLIATIAGVFVPLLRKYRRETQERELDRILET